MSDAVLYESNETNFNTLGLGPLSKAKKVHVTEERNGVFQLEMVYPTDGPHFKELKNNRIIKANAGHELKNQRFRIGKIGKEFRKDGQRFVTVFAFHVSQLAAELPMKPIVHILTLNCEEALRVWKSAILDPNPFVVSSDINTVASTYWHIRNVTNPRLALGGVEGSILDKYGGEYKFDNYHISLLKQRGKRANTIIAYGRNLTDLQQEENIINTYTSVFPYAIYTENEEEKMVTVDGYIVDSIHTSKYPNRKVFPLDLSNEFSDDDKPTKAKLKKLADQYIKNNDVGVPSVSMKVEYIDLAQTLDYKGTAVVEEINLCDEVPVFFEALDINTTAKVIRVVWDHIMDRYDSIELGHSRATFGQIINNIEKQVNQVQSTVNEVQVAANGKNMVFRGPDTPKAQNIGDQWYKPNGDYVELYIWDGQEWEFVMSTKPDPAIQEAIDELEKETEKNKAEIEVAVQKADQSIIDAGFSKNLADQAKGIADHATTNAIKAITDAKSALDNYKTLSIGSRNLLLASDTKITSIDYMINKYKMSEAMSVGETYTLRIKGTLATKKAYFGVWLDGGMIKLCELKDVGNGYYTGTFLGKKGIYQTDNYINIYVVPNSITDESSIEWIKLEKGNKPTDWSPAPEDVQIQITNISGELSQKVSQTIFDKLQGTVSLQNSQIAQNKNDIALKANQTEVNTLTGKVRATESKLSIQAGQIAGLVTKTDGQTTDIAQLKLTADGLSSTVSKVRTELDELNTSARNLVPISFVVSSFGEIIKDGYQFKFNSTGVAYSGIAIKISDSTSLEPKTKYVFGYKIRRVSGELVNFGGHIGGSEAQTWIDGKRVTGRYGSGLGNWFSEDMNWHTVVIMLETPEMLQSNPDFYIQASRGNTPIDPWSIEVKDLYVYESNLLQLDWQPAPEDIATQVDYSNIQQTVQGIQTTVANKAEQSQITQLATQITSVVSSVNNLSSGSGNLFVDSQGETQWMVAGNSGIDQMQLPEDLSPYGKSKKIIMSEGAGGPYKAPARRLVDGRTYAWSVYVKSDISGKLKIGAEQGGIKEVNVNDKWQKFTHIFNANDHSNRAFIFYRITKEIKELQIHSPTLVEGNIIPNWSESITDLASQSQITQLSNLINLRVEKNKIISQINISPENILLESKLIHLSGKSKIDDAVITNAMIANAAITDAKIQNASISNAKLLSVDAGKIVSGFLDSNRIKANSITADKLTSNAIQIGFNSMGSAMKLSPYDLGFYSGGNLTGRLTSDGMEFWYGSRKIGRMGETSRAGYPSIRGISNSLEYTGDFVSWSYKQTSTATAYTALLTLDPKGLFTGKKGIHLSQDVYISGVTSLYEISTGGNSTQKLKFWSTIHNGMSYPSLVSSTGQAGMFFSSSELYLLRNNVAYPLSKIVNIIDKLTGLGSVAIPTGFASDGTARSWYNLYF